MRAKVGLFLILALGPAHVQTPRLPDHERALDSIPMASAAHRLCGEAISTNARRGARAYGVLAGLARHGLELRHRTDALERKFRIDPARIPLFCIRARKHCRQIAALGAGACGVGRWRDGCGARPIGLWQLRNTTAGNEIRTIQARTRTSPIE